jgi:hypothetical protein
MDKIFAIILILSLTAACNQERNSKNSTARGSAGIPVMPADSRVSKIVQTNLWMFEHYISYTDFENGKKNRGRWIWFKRDGTFESGYWEQKTGSGSWYLEEGGKYPVLKIDSFNDAEDSAWEMQGIPTDASEMSWVGVKDYPNYGDMVKMLNMLTPPTKKQFREE